MQKTRFLFASLIVACGLTFSAGSVKASVQDFYTDKTVSILVPYSPGGGWDTYARLAARYMKKYIPGNPSVIVKNMPGAGGMVSVNYVYNRAKPDGLTIGMFQTTNVFPQLTGDSSVKFDASKLEWIGAFAARTSTCVASDASPFRTIQDVIDSEEPMYVGATGRGGSLSAEALFLNELIGTNFEVVPGYQGTSGVRMALVRDEVQGLCGWGYSSLKSTGKELLEKGQIHILIQVAHRKHPEIPENVPLITELVPEEKKSLLNVYLIPRVVGWNMMLPPGVDPAKVSALREAFAKMMKDPEFLAEAEKLQLTISPIEGEEIADMFERLFAEATAEDVKKIKEILYSEG